MTKEKIKEIMDAHILWLDDNGGDRADLSGANLSYADLRYADLRRADLRDTNLRGANLRRANLSGADLNFSSWPLWCGSIGVKLCDKNIKQLIYHAIVNMTKEQQQEFLKDPIDYANGFHMIGEVEEIVKL